MAIAHGLRLSCDFDFDCTTKAFALMCRHEGLHPAELEDEPAYFGFARLTPRITHDLAHAELELVAPQWERASEVRSGSPAEQADGLPSLNPWSLAPSSTDTSTCEVGKEGVCEEATWRLVRSTTIVGRN